MRETGAERVLERAFRPLFSRGMPPAGLLLLLCAQCRHRIPPPSAATTKLPNLAEKLETRTIYFEKSFALAERRRDMTGTKYFSLFPVLDSTRFK